jgi:hypothetical protein
VASISRPSRDHAAGQSSREKAKLPALEVQKSNSNSFVVPSGSFMQATPGLSAPVSERRGEQGRLEWLPFPDLCEITRTAKPNGNRVASAGIMSNKKRRAKIKQSGFRLETSERCAKKRMHFCRPRYACTPGDGRDPTLTRPREVMSSGPRGCLGRAAQESYELGPERLFKVARTRQVVNAVAGGC